MTVIITLPPETEAKLVNQAAASGKDVSTFVREAVEAKLSGGNGAVAPDNKSNDQWQEEFNAWMRDVEGRRSVYPHGFVVDDSRESIYEAGGE
jgi:hypothetical protein